MPPPKTLVLTIVVPPFFLLPLPSILFYFIFVSLFSIGRISLGFLQVIIHSFVLTHYHISEFVKYNP
ncbi:hypothetical protein ES332_A08G218300v1 [Gossypium tomentosum]|uniref:Uncharacterized protein n=1 Tax=Gossypium tomentosum TaxID=34277 RepID=A0A5D2PHX0_GOSTO|nr:hypothetical protein ES332_A08G218300v1 [Gossypium tomentosum]